ncbi:DNA translocase FtsK [Petroclostridium sp. X23]|uniref:FtsK/SpoIIIE family DNA translocase n=1 Tax=Petroclostridium sp. X23 TaxID=3045146 RepID=UPI0024ACAD0F|nr:DNA translocase FtsK [Petroclostridium sp. X23]WHH58993.1 DNA translocase FtsK 4TM domain-containing protein [Petroclostridium sp. X23]
MAKRKIRNKTKSKEIHNSINIEITALFIVALGLLMGVSFFSEAAGFFGERFKNICMGLFGYLVYIVPFLVTGYGVHYIVKRGKIKSHYKYLISVVLFIILSAVMHIFSRSKPDDLTLRESMEVFYELGSKGKGGGVVGGLIAEPIVNMFGVWGAAIVFITLTLIFIMIITEISLFKVAAFLYPFIQKGISGIYQKMITSFKSAMIERKNKVEDEKQAFQQAHDREPLAVEHQAAANEPPFKIYDHRSRENTVQRQDAVPDKQQSKGKPASGTPKQEEMPSIASSNEYIKYAYPPVDLMYFDASSQDGQKGSHNDLRQNAKKLVETLKSFGVEAKVLQVSRGPSVTRYELQPSAGVKVSKIVNLSDDIALNLAASGVRIEAPIPGKAAIGIEVANKEVTPVYLREVIESEEFTDYPSKVAFAVGKDITGRPVVANIARMPHLLIAGATGSGKSVCINTLITSILYKANPNEVKLLMIDPKVVELGVYNGIPHLLIPVVTDPKKAAGALNWAVQEMVNRYKLFADNNVRDLKGYNDLIEEGGEPEKVLPQIVIIIDELADLMMVAPGDVEDAICRLAQMARAAGMHLVIATQRPSVDVITGVIKANIPSRISFAVSSQVDSRTILDMAGAEKLLGKGDMLFYPVGESKPTRLQGAFISDKEVESIVQFIKSNSGANYHEDIMEHIEKENEVEEIDPGDNDELLPQAIELVVDNGQASVSMLQRRLKVGYARAARLVDQMEARGIVGGFEGSKPRQVLITKQQYQEMMNNQQDG